MTLSQFVKYIYVLFFFVCKMNITILTLKVNLIKMLGFCLCQTLIYNTLAKFVS